MAYAAAIGIGLLLLSIVLLDAFQTIILPRRPAGRLRLTRLFFLATWAPWAFLAERMPSPRVREQAFSIYGPLSLLLLIGVWAVFLIASFALIFFGMGSPLNDALHPQTLLQHLRQCLYVSGTTLFTLGLGDVTPSSYRARMLIVAEGGIGLGFVALVIGYVPVLYGAFSRREVAVALLDARAGSPPTAGELLLRHHFDGGAQALTVLLAEWERWCAEMLESHISYPILCYYRSQHDNQSWLSSITAILDTCALLITTIEGPATRQAQLTFAIARHTLVDLGHVFHRETAAQICREKSKPRLPDAQFLRLCRELGATGFSLCGSPDTRQRLDSIRQLYEPHAQALGDYLRMDLPLWLPAPRDPSRKPDQWTTVSSLRTPQASNRQFTPHISQESAASRLNESDIHG